MRRPHSSRDCWVGFLLFHSPSRVCIHTTTKNAMYVPNDGGEYRDCASVERIGSNSAFATVARENPGICLTVCELKAPTTPEVPLPLEKSGGPTHVLRWGEESDSSSGVNEWKKEPMGVYLCNFHHSFIQPKGEDDCAPPHECFSLTFTYRTRLHERKVSWTSRFLAPTRIPSFMTKNLTGRVWNASPPMFNESGFRASDIHAIPFAEVYRERSLPLSNRAGWKEQYLADGMSLLGRFGRAAANIGMEWSVGFSMPN